MINKPVLSVIIATLNSEQLLPMVLDSVNRQTFPLKKIEILVIDGGSTDKTLEIAKDYKCTIIHNPKTVPAYAKYIGYKCVTGKYAMYLDSDEVIESRDSFKQKMAVFENSSLVHAVTSSGYRSPKGYIFLNRYINEFGDPFSFFYYRLSKDSRYFIPTMKKRYKVTKENNNCLIFDFTNCKNLPIFELVAMGSIVDTHYLKKQFPKVMENPGLIPHFFNLLISKGSHIAVTKNDELIHYSSNTLTKYLGKITSRVINNIYTSAAEGFKGRDEFSEGLTQYKKYFFIPYAFSIIFPLLDSCYLSITRKDFGYFIHLPLCLYTALLIMYYTLLKQFGYTPVFKSYGQTKSI